MPAARAQARTEYAALARRPGYVGFVLTVSLSRTGSAMFITSGVLLVLARTGSVGLAGLTGAASMLPGALTGPLLGAWLDVARRRRVLIVVGPALAGALAGAIGPSAVIEIQAGLTVVAAVLIAGNPVFEARSIAQAESLWTALRDGTRAQAHHRLLRHISAASLLANFSWGLMTIAFPLYAVRELHAGTHAGGYLAGTCLRAFSSSPSPAFWRDPPTRARSRCASATRRRPSAARCSTR